MKYEVITDVGKKRENNEDFYYIPSSLDKPLFVVADGMGGRKGGEVASKMAITSVINHIDFIDSYKSIDDLEEAFIRAFKSANEEIYKKASADEKYEGMGTTLTVAYIYDDVILLGNVGDSRSYAISESGIMQLTDDDSLVNDLLKMGEITEVEARTHPKRNVITNAVGTKEDLDISLVRYEYAEGEYLLLCTDGVTDMLTDEEILSAFQENESIEDVKSDLLKKSLEAGGRDNITFIIICLEGGVDR
ncbi:MAG: Stp1/IreP family PP2C-type Ser/Thr phosphatase [Tissierellia bacterium]|nr:Stp1/IreP family PP2C-type Ser/Thr phosphatase [Tissierellia bacterium]